MKTSGRKAARPRVAMKPQPYLRAGYRPRCRGPKLPNQRQVGSQSHHSSPWTLILRDGISTELRETAVAPSITKEHCTPQLDPAVLGEIPRGTSSVRSEESQPPYVSGVEETPAINRDEKSSSNSPLRSPNEIMISSSATPPPRRYPLQLRKPSEKLNL